MSVNKYQAHVFVIPEDRADEQIANGFVLHDQVNTRRIQVLPCANGWSSVLEKFQTEYIPHLRSYQHGYVVLLIDFDNKYTSRRAEFDKVVPDDLKNRTFVVGAKQTPELLRQALGKNWEDIGLSLADDCYSGLVVVWGHDHLKHNEPDRLRLIQCVRSFLFGKSEQSGVGE
jgi:hypothetical protein